MENLYIAATASSPEVNFQFDEHALSLMGESYPENAAAFYGQVITALQQYLNQGDLAGGVTLDVSLTYFNSSSTKMLFSLFSMLNERAQSGVVVVVNWYHDAEDEMMHEFGQELRDDFGNLKFFIHSEKS